MAALRVGLTGGIGSGKSVVAEMLRAHGATIVDADVLARDVVEPGLPAHAEIAKRFPSVIGPDERIDRPALARIVFADDAERAALNAIVHPRVRARAALLEHRAPADAVVVHVIPLLFETDLWKSFDRTVAVVAPDDERIARVVVRDATTREAVLARIAAQMPAAEVAEHADIVIANDADLATLETRVALVYDDLRASGETRTIAFPPRRPT